MITKDTVLMILFAVVFLCVYGPDIVRILKE